MVEAVRKIGVTEQTSYRRKKKSGGLRTDQAKRLKELEKKNARLNRLLADAALDKAILREGAEGKFRAGRSGGRRSSTCVAWFAAIASANAGHAV